MVPEKLTGTYDDLGLRYERDAFDTLIEQAPDKLMVVKKVSHGRLGNATKLTKLYIGAL